MTKYTLIVLTALYLLSSCKSNRDSVAPSQQSKHQDLGITFLDSTAAAQQIITDRVDGFFAALSVTEISIQMKSADRYDSREAAVAAYKNMLQTEVYTYTAEEEAVLTETMTEAKRILDKINPKLWPKNIDLIKTRTNHYGPDVYYTREDAIIIPDNVFAQQRTADMLLPVMLHEIYHLLSRQHKSFRDKTFALIDFFPHGKNIVMSPILGSRRLTNPDGVTTDYAISLTDADGKEQLSLPFLISNQPYFSASIPSFFSYLGFDLYALDVIDDRTLRISSDPTGKTTLSSSAQADYFVHIADNTQYVIHPEEVMADNFMLGVMAYDSEDYSDFSPQGKKLIDELLTILKATTF